MTDDATVLFNREELQLFQNNSTTPRVRIRMGILSVERCTVTHNGQQAKLSVVCRSAGIATAIRDHITNRSRSVSSFSACVALVPASASASSSIGTSAHQASVPVRTNNSYNSSNNNNNSRTAHYDIALTSPPVDLVPISARDIGKAFRSPYSKDMEKRAYIFGDARISHIHFGVAEQHNSNDVPEGADMRDALSITPTTGTTTAVGCACGCRASTSASYSCWRTTSARTAACACATPHR